MRDSDLPTADDVRGILRQDPHAEIIDWKVETERVQRLCDECARTIGDLRTALDEIKDCLGYAKNEGKSSAVREGNAHSAWKIAVAALSRS